MTSSCSYRKDEGFSPYASHMVLANNDIHLPQLANEGATLLEGALALYTIYLEHHSRVVTTYNTQVIGNLSHITGREPT